MATVCDLMSICSIHPSLYGVIVSSACHWLFYSVVYKIGSVMQQVESRTMEFKTGGGRYPLTILREVSTESRWYRVNINLYQGWGKQPPHSGKDEWTSWRVIHSCMFVAFSSRASDDQWAWSISWCNACIITSWLPIATTSLASIKIACDQPPLPPSLYSRWKETTLGHLANRVGPCVYCVHFVLN